MMLLLFALALTVGRGPLHEWAFLKVAAWSWERAQHRLYSQIFLPATNREIVIAIMARRAERSGARHSPY